MGSQSHIDMVRYAPEDIEFHVQELGALLHSCVHDGASISFVLPFSQDDGEAFWRDKVLPQVRNGRLALIVAQGGAGIAGAVQLDCDTPPNQAHRAEMRKLLVHPRCRRQGIGRALVRAAEELARQLERSLITLDTRSGDKAEPLYASLGYKTAGAIPGYCRDPFEDRLDSTTIMYKVL